MILHKLTASNGVRLLAETSLILHRLLLHYGVKSCGFLIHGKLHTHGAEERCTFNDYL